MKIWHRTAAFALLGGVLWGIALPASAAAQATDGDARYWWSASLGAGSARFTCDLCTVTRDAGPSLDLAFGARASDRLAVGVETGLWSRMDGSVRESVYRAGLTAHLYPLEGRGLHLIGGAGWSGYRADEIGYDSGRLSLGAGWDLPLGEGWWVGNALVLDASSFGSLKSEDDRIDDDVGLSVVRLTVFFKRR